MMHDLDTMSKRTAALIVFLTLLTAFFVYLAVSQNSRPSPKKESTASVTPTKKPVPAFTTLSLSQQGSTVVVLIDTHGEKNKVTAVQLELSYDPKKVSGVKLTPGTFLPQAIPLINTVDPKTGRVTYALAISPTQKPMSGSGTLATISFQPIITTGTTEIQLLPKSLVTAEGISESVLKSASGTQVQLSPTASAR